MIKLLAITAIVFLGGCSTVRIEHATIREATFNSASWKSQAGVAGDARIDATTSPTTDASLTGL
jgi:hypothetical protein